MHDTDDNLSDVLATLNRISQNIIRLQRQIFLLSEQAKQNNWTDQPNNQEDSQWQSVLRNNSTNQDEPTA